MVEEFRRKGIDSGVFEQRRQHQLLEWMRPLVQDDLQARFLRPPAVAAQRSRLEREVAEGTPPVATAVEALLNSAWPLKAEGNP